MQPIVNITIGLKALVLDNNEISREALIALGVLLSKGKLFISCQRVCRLSSGLSSKAMGLFFTFVYPVSA